MTDDVRSRVERVPDPGEERVASRAEALKREPHPPKDPKRAARALLEESDARTDEDPAPRDPHHRGVDKRTSAETTPPPDLPM